MPVNEPDIWRSAKLLVDQHGRDAAVRAAQRADELLASGEMEGKAVCIRRQFVPRPSSSRTAWPSRSLYS